MGGRAGRRPGVRCGSPMSPALDLCGLEAPVVQAGMGSVARHELAAAVSEAGGVGTIAGVRAPIAAEVAAARRLTGRPIAVNLLLPFVRPGDAEAAADADAIVTFWGSPRRIPVLAAGGIVDAEGVKAALEAGAVAAVAGTRFLLSDESRAHPGYTSAA